jgi:Zn-dependent metalloprotease
MITRGTTVFSALVISSLIAGHLFAASTAPLHVPPNHPFALKISRHREPTDQQRAALARDLLTFSQQAALAKTPAGRASSPSAQGPAVARLTQVNGGPVSLTWNEDGTVPIFIRGERLQQRNLQSLGKATAAEYLSQANSFLQENSALLRVLEPTAEFVPVENVRDELGMTHIRFQQYYQGMEVWGRDVRVHLTADGNVESFNGRSVPTPLQLRWARPAIDGAAAQAQAAQEFGRTPDSLSSRSVIYVDQDDQFHICWLVHIEAGLGDRWDYFVDAVAGTIVKKYSRVMEDGAVTGSGVDLYGQSRTLHLYQIGTTYYMIDASKSMFNPGLSKFPNDGKGVIYTMDGLHSDTQRANVTSSNQNSWSSPQAVSASANGALVFDYYKTVHNRNAIDGTGSTMNLVVNYQTNLGNAFWNGQEMVFGNGDGTRFKDLAGGFDVASHEMTHGVIEHTANLVYEAQSGALNESFADVFGILCKWWVRGTAGNWLLGDDVVLPPAQCLRNMQDPGAANALAHQPTKMSEFVNTSTDNGGVHTNSGITNRAFYLFATSAGMTKDDAGRVYYRALSQYLTRNSQFVDCRLAVIKAAEDLFGGPGNAKALAAAAAFDAVEITTGTGTAQPPTRPPVAGTASLLIIDAGSGILLRWPIGTQTLVQLSSVPVASRPSVTDNGATILYVDQANNVHAVASDGTGDQTITQAGIYNNVAVSPDGHYLAATTTTQSPIMILFDLTGGTATRQIRLFTPTYSQGVNAGNILFPDRIAWTSDSKVIMYDAFNIVANANGDTTGYWDINLLRVGDEAIARLLPPQPPGIDMGDPVFASNSDNKIAFDYIDQTGNASVLAVNLNENTTALVANNGTSPGNPTFAPDDKKVYINSAGQTGWSILAVTLQADGITGTGSPAGVLSGAAFPVAFAIGTRPTDVKDTRELPTEFRLEQNYPNPFNPSTLISYALPKAAEVRLEVYNALGQKVATLVDGPQQTGIHQVRFDGTNLASGVYFYRLQARPSEGGQGYVDTRKLVLTK